VRGDRIPWLRSSLVLGAAATMNSYDSTATPHLLINPTPKRRRHAARLSHDVHDFLTLGRIRPAASSLTEYADISLYQDGMPKLPDCWQPLITQPTGEPADDPGTLGRGTLPNERTP
jgi:hypothetical protein